MIQVQAFHYNDNRDHLLQGQTPRRRRQNCHHQVGRPPGISWYSSSLSISTWFSTDYGELAEGRLNIPA